jgi:hypothetical protein
MLLTPPICAAMKKIATRETEGEKLGRKVKRRESC